MAFSVRSAIQADYSVVARLFRELGVADPLPDSVQFAERMLPRVVILEDDGGSDGYASWRTYGRTAHVVNVVVDPKVQGRGGGRALMREVHRRVVADGCARWYLNVKQDNVPAIRLYARSGMAIEQEGWSLDIDWARLTELEDEGTGVLFTPAQADDVDIAAHLGVEVERTAHLRAQPGVTLLALREGGPPVAFGAFDAAYPSICPLRVKRVGLAWSLLEAFRRRACHAHVLAVVEDNRGLFEALRTAGGTLRHATYRMGAAVG